VRAGTLSGETVLCRCGGPLDWEDCPEGHTDCYQTVCAVCVETERDCEEADCE
jgi:hypothetical protein